MSPLQFSQKSNEYTLISDDKYFKIKITLSSNILIEINELENIKGLFYSKSFSLEDLITISKGFKICDNINEAYDILEEIFQDKKALVKYTNENIIVLVINVSLLGGRIQQAELPLNLKEVNKTIVIENLFKKVKSLEKENANLKNEINEIKKKEIRPFNNQNIPPNKNYLFLFQQLKEYYNFRNKFLQTLENDSFYNHFIQNEFYLIDRKWIKNWKKYSGYNYISHILNRSRDLNDNDYDWVVNIMNKNMEENILPPLNNNIIFHDNIINPLADFIIINQKCHDLFIPENKEFRFYEKSYPIRFFKEKLLLLLQDNIFFILFKNIEKKVYYELLIIIPKESRNRRFIINEIGNPDLNPWLKKQNFDLDCTEEKSAYIYGDEITIINKTLKLSKQDYTTI